MKTTPSAGKKLSAFAMLLKNKKGKNAGSSSELSVSYINHDTLSSSQSESDNVSYNSHNTSKASQASSIDGSKSLKQIKKKDSKKKIKADIKKLKKKDSIISRATYLHESVINSPLNIGPGKITKVKAKKKIKAKLDVVADPDSTPESPDRSPSISWPSSTSMNLLSEIAEELHTKKIKKSVNPPRKRKLSRTEETDITNRAVLKHGDAPYMYDSSMEASKLFKCLIYPVKPDKFFNELWEKKPLLVKRHVTSYNDGWFSTAELDRILRKENIQFSVNLDVTTYENGSRETHNPVGRAYAPVVWDFYQNGCSIRLLNPQTYSKNVWKFSSILQEYFGSCVGSNIYLTPPGSQGFAPHYDDIEAFILQLEGKKHWKLYSPRSDSEELPRFSSGNFKEEEVGETILDVILEAGDMLYFPRGTIHQANTPADSHSLHITISTCQKNTWGDMLEKLVPRALQVAIEENVEFRKSLPKNYLNYMGVANQDIDSPERTAFLRNVEQLMTQIISYAPVDASCDQMGVGFIHDILPPVLSEAEKSCSIHGSGERWDKDRGGVINCVEIEPDTEIKLIRKGVIRLVTEEDKVRVYHSLENARIYHAEEPQYVDITAEAAPAIECLIHAYPEYVKVESLPLDTLAEKTEISSMLYDKGLVITSEPLEPIVDTSSEGE